MAEKKKKLLTPVGFAKWAHVQEPKENHFDPKKDPQYMIDVCFKPDDPEWRVWAGDLKRAVEATQGKNMPIKREVDSEDNPTGRFFVTFKTGAKFKPHVYDKYGNLMDVMIGNESKVRIAYVTSDYLGFGGGVALYLNAVQVIDLVEFKPQSASAFGFTVEAAPAAMAGGPPQAEDDLPF